MEAYLRHYVSYKQNNWISLLPIAQLALNDKRSDITGLSPFFTNYGRHANLFLEPREGSRAERATVVASDMKRLHSDMQQTISEVNTKTQLRVNKKRKMYPQLKKGDKVYLYTKNLKSKRPNKKLDHVKVRPFLIKQPKGPVNYEL